jgi:hypothetical protein
MKHYLLKQGTLSENNSLQVKAIIHEMETTMILSKINQYSLILNTGNEDIMITVFKNEYQEPKYKLASRLVKAGEISICN